MFKRFINWLIKKLGGKTGDEYEGIKKALKIAEKDAKIYKNALSECAECSKYHKDKYDKLRSQLKDAESHIAIDAGHGYTEDNVIEASKAQTMFNLGKAVYPYAEHFITGDGVYIASVGVVDWEDKE